MEEKHLDAVCDATDILQIGSRNMQNYPLIVESAKTGFPIMLKRHYGALLEIGWEQLSTLLRRAVQN